MFSVSVVPPDLRHEETIIQSVNSLERLQVTISGIFNRIDARIDRNNAKIEDLQSRISLANNKISSLTGINKAIKIFSPAKFPASHVFRDIPQTFDMVHPAEELAALKQDYRIESNQDPVSHRNMQEKLIFYHVRSTRDQPRLARVLNQKQGLGLISQNISSVNSLLIYNTASNAYEQTQDVNLALKETIRGKPSQASEESSGHKIDAAPLSISQRQKAEKRFNQELFYTPKLNDAPEINVPVDLPDLPGIADDVIFDITESEKIAPSLYIENLPELPEPEAIQEKENVRAGRDIPDKSAPEVSPLKTSPPAPPPPPPPPPPASNAPSSSQLPSQSGISQGAGPPPPPPPPPPAAATLATSDMPRPRAPAPPASDARSNLMEAIRKAGGARGGKLRAAAEVVRINEPQGGTQQKKPTGDLMADLHNKLSMRRKGISGTKEAEPGGGGSVIERLSALIPPPPPSQAQANSSATDPSDDDDWAD